MTVRNDLRQLVDRISDEEARLWLEALQTGDPMLIGMALAALDDEPSSPEEDAEADEAWQEYLEGKGHRRASLPASWRGPIETDSDPLAVGPKLVNS